MSNVPNYNFCTTSNDFEKRNFAWFFTTEEEKKRKIKINQMYGCNEI